MANICWTAERGRLRVLEVLLMAFVDERSKVLSISSSEFPENGRSSDTWPSIHKNLKIY